MTSIEMVAEKIEAMSTQLHTVDLAIRGDGRSEPGLAARTALLESYVAETRRLIRWVAFGLLALFLNLLWEVVVTYTTKT